MVTADKFEWRGGDDRIARFRLPDGWGPSRCEVCGSPVPETYDNDKHMWVPAGLMDDDLETEIKLHIFCGSRADWDKESSTATYFDAYPE